MVLARHRLAPPPRQKCELVVSFEAGDLDRAWGQHARWHVFKVLAAILCIAGLTWLGMEYIIPAPPSQLTIATSPKGEHYHVLGTRYQGIMAESEVKVELRETDGAKENLRLLNDPNSGIQIGFMQGGISNSRLSPDVMSLGRDKVPRIRNWQVAASSKLMLDCDSIAPMRASADTWLPK